MAGERGTVIQNHCDAGFISMLPVERLPYCADLGSYHIGMHGGVGKLILIDIHPVGMVATGLGSGHVAPSERLEFLEIACRETDICPFPGAGVHFR